MDELIYGLTLTIAAAILTYAIVMSKRKGWDDTIKDKIDTYNFLFTIMGAVIRTIDQKLYDEMCQVIDKLNALYQSENVTAKDLEIVINEAKDVFDRAKDIYYNHTGQKTDS